MSVTAGVLAVQGDVSEHAQAIKRAASAHDRECTIHEVRTEGVIPNCDVLLLPGGESTTISRLVRQERLDAEIVDHVEAGKPLLGTCAGLILLSSDSVDEKVETLDVLDATVKRNAFGRQRDSFEANLDVRGLESPFPAVFIRAPLIERVGEDVEVLAEWNGSPVAVRHGSTVGTAFHPELREDTRIHDIAFFDALESVDSADEASV